MLEQLLLKKLLGGQKSAPGAPPIQQAPPMEEVVVQENALPKSQYKTSGGILEALFPKTFAPGTTAGNILGHIKDGLLVQGGAKPMHAPRLQQLRTNEALGDFDTDPMAAIRKLGGIDGGAMVDLLDKYQDNTRQQQQVDSIVRGNNDKFEETTHQRAGSLIGASTASTYPALRKKYYDYYKVRGVEPLADLPETYDEASLSALRNVGISPEDQARFQSQRDYRAALMAQRDRFEQGRNSRYDKGITVRREEGDANRDVRTSEGTANRRNSKEIAEMRGGRSRPKVKFGTRPDGTRYVIQ